MHEFTYRNNIFKIDLDKLKLNYNNKEIILVNKLLQQRSVYYIKFSSLCNLSCTYCFQNKDKIIKKNNNSNIFLNILDKILNNKEIDIILFGGEPFLDENISDLNLLFEKLKTNGRISAFTNGCFSSKIMDFLYEHRNNLSNLIISIDGIENIHNKRRPMKDENSFKRIIENIHKLIKLNISTVISINLDIENLSSLEELIAFLSQEFGLENIGIILNRVRHSKKEIKEIELLKTYIDIRKKYDSPFISLNSVIYSKIMYVLNNLGYMRSRCRLGISYVIDFEQGILYTCPQLSDTYIGNFSESDIFIDERKTQEYLNMINKNSDACNNCKYINYCKYGCIAEDIPYDYCKIETENELNLLFDNFEYFFDLKEEYLEALNFYNK